MKMIKKEQLRKWGKNLEKKKKKNKILRDKIERKKKQTKKMIKKKKNNNQENEYHIWYINKTKSNGKGLN
jgi:hypothetical protein